MRLIPHGDVSAALLAVTERSPVDLLWGIGGTPEGVISAAAIKCIGGSCSAGCGRATTTSARPRSTPATTSTACSRSDDLVAGDDCFFSATGVTDGDVLQGVRYPSAARRDDRVARHALALGHGPAHPRAPRPREAARARRRAATAELERALGAPRRRRRVLGGRARGSWPRRPTRRGRAAPASAGSRA